MRVFQRAREASFILLWLLLVGDGAAAEFRTPAFIADNMVLQQGMKVPIWGTGVPGRDVEVSFQDQNARTTVNQHGEWMVVLGPFKSGGPCEMSITADETIIYKNIMVGEVWLCSGQSNMQWKVRQSLNAEEEIASATFLEIRKFAVVSPGAEEPKKDAKGAWTGCHPGTAGSFSAVAFFFGRHLHQSLDVPIGLLESCVGGTPAEAWTSRPALQSDPELAVAFESWDQSVAEYEQKKREYPELLADWEQTSKQKEKSAREKKPKPPKAPSDASKPAGLYNGKIAPLIPYAIRGVIWYQGEANVDRAYQYRSLFPALIQDWRQNWGQGDFPFLFVQLANYKIRESEPGESKWAELREAQLMTLSVPNTAMAVAIDIGEAESIHPRNKQEAGRRLAVAALGTVYGKDVVYSGPLYESMEIEGRKIRLHFRHVDGGLVAKGGELEGFAIAGEDREFVWADAEIDGETVVVQSDEMEKPVAVRYAWADNPVATLYNEGGLPASPFRTDEWPSVTVNGR